MTPSPASLAGPLPAPLRQFVNAPLLLAAVVLSLGIGVGVNTIAFSFLHSVFLQPVPGAADGGVGLQWITPLNPVGGNMHTSWGEFQDLRQQQKSFTELAAMRPLTPVLLSPDGTAERLWTEFVSDNYFSFLGVRPFLGRFFQPGETAAAGRAPLVVISHSLWQQRFGGEPAALGKTLILNGQPLTVIGVAPPEFQGLFTGLRFDAWIPATMSERLFPTFRNELEDRRIRMMNIVGRLKAGVTAAQAGGEVKDLFRGFASAYPSYGYERVNPVVLPSWRTRMGAQATMTPALATLEILSLIVLALSCSTTVILLLARATVREHEIAIRLALGARSGQILRLLLAESAAVALVGSALGLGFALVGLKLLASLPAPTGYPMKLTVEIRGGEALYAAIVALSCGVLCGLAPAWQLARLEISRLLKTSDPRAGGGRHWVRSTLIAVQVAVALLVLVLAGLFQKSYRNSVHLDPGFDAGRVLVVNLDAAAAGYDTAATQKLLTALVPRLETLQGVRAAAVSSELPLDPVDQKAPTAITSARPVRLSTTALRYAVTPGYFRTLGIPFIEGADLDPGTHAPRQFEAVINEEFARRCWPGRSPLGIRITIGAHAYAIVGVVKTSKYLTLNEPPAPAAFISLLDTPSPRNVLFVKTSGSPFGIEPQVRKLVDELAPGLDFSDVRTLEQHVNGNVFLFQMPAQLLRPIGPVALLLAALGIYSLVSYAVAQRQTELGLRLALGATSWAVAAVILRRGLLVMALGLAAGLLLAYGASRGLSPGLVEVSPGDPAVFLPVLGLMAAALIAACWFPVRRAIRADPAQILRAD